MSKKSFNPLALTIGAALLGSVGIASAASFALNDLGTGYMLVGDEAPAKTKAEGKCGEGKCGAAKKAAEAKAAAAAAAGNGTAAAAGDKAKAEGSCGEGKAKMDAAAAEKAKADDKH